MLCLCGFELYSRWVPLTVYTATYSIIDCLITKRKTNAKLIFASRQRAAELQIKPSLCAVRM